MQLDSLIIETRVRSGWAAIDLGFVLGRKVWLRSFCLYLLLMLPIFGLTQLLNIEKSWLVFLILWWLKPFFERPTLYILSRELFAEPISFTRALADIRQWLVPGLWWILTVRRFSVMRSMYAPVTLLERPNASDYGKRTSVLGANYSSEAVWLTVLLFHLEQFLFLAGLLLIEIFSPGTLTFFESSSNIYWFADVGRETSVLVELTFYIIVAAIAPFYAAAGFMLYISRRVELEGWDIEICFREWMSRYKAPEPHLTTSERQPPEPQIDEGQV